MQMEAWTWDKLGGDLNIGLSSLFHHGKKKKKPEASLQFTAGWLEVSAGMRQASQNPYPLKRPLYDSWKNQHWALIQYTLTQLPKMGQMEKTHPSQGF